VSANPRACTRALLHWATQGERVPAWLPCCLFLQRLCSSHLPALCSPGCSCLDTTVSAFTDGLLRPSRAHTHPSAPFGSIPPSTAASHNQPLAARTRRVPPWSALTPSLQPPCVCAVASHRCHIQPRLPISACPQLDCSLANLWTHRTTQLDCSLGPWAPSWTMPDCSAPGRVRAAGSPLRC